MRDTLPLSVWKKAIEESPQEELEALEHDWLFWSRTAQRAPEGNWQIWLFLGGRGTGKTRAGAEWVNQAVIDGAERIAIVGPTAADCRDVMVEGESGIVQTSPPWNKPVYEPSKRRLTWPSGALGTLYSADEPERLRGPQHSHAWADELGAWRYPEAWDMLLLGLRLGTNPRVCVTTTPKRTKLVKSLLTDPTCIITKSSTYENRENLPPAFLDRIIKRYEGTALGRQELNAEVIDDVDGALWKLKQIEEARLVKVPCELTRIVVALDPSTTSNEDSDECGIVVAGLGTDQQGYILDDLSLRISPDGWAKVAVTAYRERNADRIIAEANNGGDMVELTIRTVDPNVSYKKVHASRGKLTRAEPIAALYEQGRVHHVGSFPQLEDEMTSWVPGDASPNRMDALVWALTELMVGPGIPEIHSLA